MSDAKTYTIEEVNAFRAEVYRILISWGVSEADANYDCGYEIVNGIKKDMLNEHSTIVNWTYRMNGRTPEEYAEMMCM